MKLKDMIPQVRYIVTKNGNTLKKGDRIWIDFDGALMNVQAGGWLMPQEWKRLKNEVEFDKAYYEKEIEKLQAKINICKELIKKHGD